MKKIILILLCLPVIGFGQQTYVPDDNFEAYLDSNGMGNGIANDDYVTTASINTINTLDVNNMNIASLIGVEEFSKNKKILKVTYLLQRETKQTNQPPFYIYDDGTVEKRIVIE